jgi:hypothetical protein
VTSSIADNGEPCLVIDYEVIPFHWKVHAKNTSTIMRNNI